MNLFNPRGCLASHTWCFYLLAILAVSIDDSTKGLLETANENRDYFLYYHKKLEFGNFPSLDQANNVSSEFKQAFDNLNKLNLLPKNNQRISSSQFVEHTLSEMKASSTTERQQNIISSQHKKRKQDQPSSSNS